MLFKIPLKEKTMRTLLGIWGVLACCASNLPAQTPTQIVNNYIASADSVALQLSQIVDADTAQRNAPVLSPAIASLNQATAALRSLYGNSAAAGDLAAKSAAMSTSQSRLAAEQTRLTSGNCPAEGTIKSGNGSAISPTVTNKSSVVLRYQWLDYQGTRTGGGELKPGETQTLGTYLTHPFIFLNPQGQCVRIIQFNEVGNYFVSELLAPSVGPILSKLQK
jgi:hypothetical protein